MRSAAGQTQNKLLSMLAAADFAAFVPCLEPVTLEADRVIEEANQPVTYAYFLEDGIASVIATDGKKRRTEAGPFGREGMSALPLIMGADRSPHETMVQVSGRAHRVRAEELRRLMVERPAAHALLLRYVQAFSIQTAHTLLSAAHSVVETRLARWILMLQDRIGEEEFSITHQFMALMMSVRRPGITIALHKLEGEKLIRSTRGRLVVRDRKGLEALCGSLYGAPEREYARLIGVEGAARAEAPARTGLAGTSSLANPS